MDTSSTNRDLYLAISELIADAGRASKRDLEEYLRALLRVSQSHESVDALSPDDFMALLSAAFVAEALPYDPSWAATYSNDPDDLSGFLRFEAVAKRQIVDLREMREAGILDGKWIGLGVSAPRGRQWYNFDPHQYLECAAAGSIGGWEPGDGTGRDFVPGPVAALDANGQVTSADPREVERPIYAVPRVSWERFSDFLICGQIYE